MSRLSRAESILERAERAHRDHARTSAMIHHANIVQLLRETVPVDVLIDLTREVHARDSDAETRLLDLVAEAIHGWEIGKRPGSDHAARNLLDRERTTDRRRLGDLRR